MVEPGRRALVTGGAGFIGSHLVDALLDQGADHVTVVDSYFLGNDDNLRGAQARHPSRLTIHREDAGDETAMSAIVEEAAPDVVFNLATKALRYSFLNPPGACRVNVDIALTLCELLRRRAFPKLVHVSTSEVYGTASYVPMDEAHPLLAETTYAAGKAAADLAVASYVRMFDVDAVTVRPFNNYGPRQNDTAFAAVIPLTIRRILAGEPPVIEGSGEQTRDFSFVRDTVRSLLRAADLDLARGTVMNLGSGRETSVRQIIDSVAGILDWTGPYEERPPRPADVQRHCAEVSRATSLLGPMPVTALDEGLAETVAWYVESRR
jgi:UDP-glucose 4-epimerase